MDAIQMLIEDHKEAEELFLMYERATTEIEEEAIVLKLCKALSLHMQLEEQIFYPAARVLFNDEDDELIDEAEDEHSTAKKIIGTLKNRDAGFRMDLTVKALKVAIEHHVEEEETEVFPKLQALSMDTQQLGEQMAERKLQLQNSMV